MDLQLHLTVKTSRDEQSKSAPWVAYNPELDIASCGPTSARARKNLEEAIKIVLNGAVEDGNLKELLTDSGFEIKNKSLKPPSIKVETFKMRLKSDATRQLWHG